MEFGFVLILWCFCYSDSYLFSLFLFSQSFCILRFENLIFSPQFPSTVYDCVYWNGFRSFHSKCSSLVGRALTSCQHCLSLRDSTVRHRWLRSVLLRAGPLSHRFAQMPRAVPQASQTCRAHSERPLVLLVPSRAPCEMRCQQQDLLQVQNNRRRICSFASNRLKASKLYDEMAY
jgi:hypothetical protein